jgi:ribosome recycling factor
MMATQSRSLAASRSLLSKARLTSLVVTSSHNAAPAIRLLSVSTLTTFGPCMSDTAIFRVPFSRPEQLQAFRWKHAAKKKQHLEVLDDMAHDKEREQAQERRQKKKERKLKKKAKKGGEVANEKGGSAPAAAASEKSAFAMEGGHDDEDHFDDDDEDESDEVELPDASEIKDKMMKIVATFEESLKAIRGAEPTPELFDDIVVHAYDSETPLKQVAQAVITSPTMATVTCFDPALVKEVRDSIQMQLGLNPQTDTSEGDGVLKVPLPNVSLETRQKTAQQLGKRAENFRQRIRRVRRRYNSIIKQGKEGKLEHISKDDVFRVAKEIDDVTEQIIKKLNDITDKKHQSIMDV